jgi:predicted ATP-grasp superfamily ATP-dependent carboligase
MRFTGIAEVEYKWEASSGEYQLIEINPRPWDQHRLGKTCGTDLVLCSYCDHAGLKTPALPRQAQPQKWIAEDTFCMTALRLLWNRDPKWWTLFRLARGRRIYAVWSTWDPLPSVAYCITRFIPGLFRTGAKVLCSAIIGRRLDKVPLQGGSMYEKHFENDKRPS